MKIATWNVNSLKVRLLQVLQWLKDNPVDILCLQETKLTDEKFPLTEIEAAGYRAVFTGQKTYNGVAILAKETASDIVRNNPLFPDEQQRIVAATFGKIRIVCAYVPNGQSVGSDKYRYKIEWLRALRNWLEEEKKKYPVSRAPGRLQHRAGRSGCLRSGCMGWKTCLFPNWSVSPFAPCSTSASSMPSVSLNNLKNPTAGGITGNWLFRAIADCGWITFCFPENWPPCVQPVLSTASPEMETAFGPYSCYRRTRSLNSGNNGKR